MRGINYDARLGAGDLEAEIINNMIDDVFDGVEMRTRDGHNLCTIISGNAVTNVTGNDAYHIRETDPTHNIETAEANATAQVANNNSGTPVSVDMAVGTVAVGTCDLSQTDLPSLSIGIIHNQTDVKLTEKTACEIPFLFQYEPEHGYVRKLHNRAD